MIDLPAKVFFVSIILYIKLFSWAIFIPALYEILKLFLMKET